MANQILDEERASPTVTYRLEAPSLSPAEPVAHALGQRGTHPRTVQATPDKFKFSSTNFDLLCSLLDRMNPVDRPEILNVLISRLSNPRSYRRTSSDIMAAGSWRTCSSELPLVAEFLARRGSKHLLITAISKAAIGPGITLLLVQMGEMIALNFTLFTADEYEQLVAEMSELKRAIR